MPRRYDISLLERLEKGAETVVYKDVPVLVKPIPEGGNDGDMDPRIYKTSKMMPVLKHFIPKPRKNATPLQIIMPYRKMFGSYKGDRIADEGVITKDVKVESYDGFKVPVKIYKRENPGENLPIMVYYHGGGFFGGGVHIVEQMCKTLVQKLDCIALNVDYRLCPENHYPQPMEDCWAALKWVYENAESLGGDREKIAVSGDSAGGNLAAVMTMRDRDEKTNMVKLQALLYPSVNMAGKNTEFYKGVDISQYRKSKKHAKVIDATAQMMGSMMGGDTNIMEAVYLQGNLPVDHPYASPIFDTMENLPYTMMIFGEHDFLAFEDFAYARALKKAGTPLKTIIYRGLSHGFADQIGVMPQAEDCMNEIAKTMAQVL